MFPSPYRNYLWVCQQMYPNYFDIDPIVIAFASCLLQIQYIMIAGREDIRIAAPISPQCSAYLELKNPAIISVIGWRDLPRQKILNVPYSFQMLRNVNTNRVVIPGRSSGTIIFRKHLTDPQPSIAAASSSSFGSALINAPIRRMPVAKLPVTHGITTAQKVPINPSDFRIKNRHNQTHTWNGKSKDKVSLHKFRRAFVHPVDGICGHCTKNADQRSDSECVQEAVQHTSGNINLI